MRVGDIPEPVSELETYEPVLQVGQMARALFDTEELGASRREYGETFFALMMGTLIKAVSDYVRYKDARSKKLREQARTAEIWLFAKTDPLTDPALSSFGWVCMVLDRDLEKSRGRIREMTTDDLPKVDRRRDR